MGESRAGVVIHGRGNVEDGVSDVLITNLTFDLTGYVQSGAFNTLNLSNGNDITIDHVTFTGDCATGATGGHIETNGTSHVLVDSCLIEKFGQCGGAGSTGHEDHGVYSRAASASRSEINIDSAGGGAGRSIAENIFHVGHALINNCYDATTLGFSIGSNFVQGPLPAGAAADCVATEATGDPQFVSASSGDYHTNDPAAASYGAYAP